MLGSGIDVDYPPSNGRLLRAVEQGGTIVGEYPPGVPAEPFRFPARNRLIAALSRGIVVVQGASRSGTRITAEHALELGLDVFAVPGSVTDPLAETPLDMIREGATMIRDADDLLLDLGIDPQRAVDPDGLPGLPAAQRSLLDALAAPMLPDAVARAAGVPVSRRDLGARRAGAPRAGARGRRQVRADVPRCTATRVELTHRHGNSGRPPSG